MEQIIQKNKLLKKFETGPPENQVTAANHFWVGLHTFRSDTPVLKTQVNEIVLKNAIASRDLQHLRQVLIGPYTVRLDGRTRFALASDQKTGNIKQSAENHLWALFENDEARKKVRKLTQDAFDLHFVIDPTHMTSFNIRMSERAPQDDAEEQALDKRARDFHSNASHISEYSDGVQAFVGLLSAILSLEHKIMLIDEPEAFPHPSLALILGENMAEIAEKRTASLIVSTHSPEFLMGCMVKVSDLSVVRLTYKNKIATARKLSSVDLKQMMQDPLLRSTKTLEALFHTAVVVTESDTEIRSSFCSQITYPCHLSTDSAGCFHIVPFNI